MPWVLIDCRGSCFGHARSFLLPAYYKQLRSLRLSLLPPSTSATVQLHSTTCNIFSLARWHIHIYILHYTLHQRTHIISWQRAKDKWMPGSTLRRRLWPGQRPMPIDHPAALNICIMLMQTPSNLLPATMSMTLGTALLI